MAAHAQRPDLEAQLLHEDPAALAKAARAQGDPVRGAVLFHQPHLSCTKCHAAGGRAPSPLGPDLAQPEPGTTDAHLVESVLAPSKVIRKGFETVTVTPHKRHVGQRAGRRRPQGRPGPARPGQADRAGDHSEGGYRGPLDRDDVAHAGRAGEPAHGSPAVPRPRVLPDRDRRVRPGPGPVAAAGPGRDRPAPAGLREGPRPRRPDPGLDDAARKRGEAVYARLCVTCHGTPDRPGSMPTSLAFCVGQVPQRVDPYAMYQTLTRGSGLMPRQPTLVPRQKYDVIHYIRETYLKPREPDAVRAGGRRLPGQAAEGDEPRAGAPGGRAVGEDGLRAGMSGTFEVGTGGTNIAYKGIAVRLDSRPRRGGGGQGVAALRARHDAAAAGVDREGIHRLERSELQRPARDPPASRRQGAVRNDRPRLGEPRDRQRSTTRGRRAATASRTGRSRRGGWHTRGCTTPATGSCCRTRSATRRCSKAPARWARS